MQNRNVKTVMYVYMAYSFLDKKIKKMKLKVTSASLENYFLSKGSPWCVMNFFIWRKIV